MRAVAMSLAWTGRSRLERRFDQPVALVGVRFDLDHDRESRRTSGRLSRNRDDGPLVEDRRHEGIAARQGFRSLLRAKVKTLSGKGLNKGFATHGERRAATPS